MAVEKINNTINLKTPVIELVDLTKNFGDREVLKGINLSIYSGEFITLLGPSGSGKTTALRLIGGFDWPTRGEIRFSGKDVKDLPAYKRPTKTIFQDYALFPHLNVEGNIKYGLKLLRVEKENVDPIYFEKLKALQQTWKIMADEKFMDLDKEQDEYTLLIETSEEVQEKLKIQIKITKQKLQATKDTTKDELKLELKNLRVDLKTQRSKAKKAQRWLDTSDFNYSYWETFSSQKTDKFSKKYLTRKLTKEEMKIEVDKILELVHLKGNEKRKIDEISGGMKQRVALARSLVCKPKVLLLDEPLSALDLKVRQKMQIELKEIQQRIGTTFIFITHDQEEALSLSDKVAVLRDGNIEQFGTPKDIYDEPINEWVADFIGESNIMKGKITSTVQVEILGKKFKADTNKIKVGSDVDIMLRPEDIFLSNKKVQTSKLTGIINNVVYRGLMWEYHVGIENSASDFIIQNTKKFKMGEKVFLDWDWDELHVMKKDLSNEK